MGQVAVEHIWYRHVPGRASRMIPHACCNKDNVRHAVKAVGPPSALISSPYVVNLCSIVPGFVLLSSLPLALLPLTRNSFQGPDVGLDESGGSRESLQQSAFRRLTLTWGPHP